MPTEAFDPQRIYSGLLILGLELALLALACAGLYAATTLILSRLVSTGSPAPWVQTVRARARNVLLAGFFLIGAAVLIYNGWLMARGLDAWAHTTDLVGSVDGRMRVAILIAFGKLALGIAGLVAITRLVRRLRRITEDAINRWDRIRSNNESLAALFGGVERVIINTARMLLAVFVCGWFGLPQSVRDTLILGIRLYLVIAIGIMVIRCVTVIVDTLDGFSERSARAHGWAQYYDHVRPLVPTFRTCLEYALWIGLGSLALLHIRPMGYLAAWGPRLIQAIGIFFAGKVVIEIGSLEIGNRMLPRTGLDQTERRRRETIVPLVRSAFAYATYFATAVLMLSALGFNPIPFLAGAGILGLVIGFGAQSMINDVVSGFFILFENTYLVGDTIEIGDARGVVEGIEFRTTKIRDADGRLHIIRNGEIKPVINYSRDYAMAVVTVEVPYDADLRALFRTLRQAGERLRADNADVTADMEIDGITAFGAKTMTIRTSTRVKPGRHEAVAAELRLLMKEMFDRQAPGLKRQTLIPAARESRELARRQGA